MDITKQNVLENLNKLSRDLEWIFNDQNYLSGYRKNKITESEAVLQVEEYLKNQLLDLNKK